MSMTIIRLGVFSELSTLCYVCAAFVLPYRSEWSLWDWVAEELEKLLCSWLHG